MICLFRKLKEECTQTVLLEKNMDEKLRLRHKERRKRLAEAIGTEGIAIIQSGEESYRNADTAYPFRVNSDFFYLTGITRPGLILLVSGRDKQSTLLLPERNEKEEQWSGTRLSRHAAVAEFGLDRGKHGSTETHLLEIRHAIASRHMVYMPEEHPFDHLPTRKLQRVVKEWAKESPCLRLVKDSRAVIGEMRLIKDGHELRLMEDAARISSDVHRQLINIITPGMSERELAAEIAYRFARRGGDPLHAYPPIVAFGDNACTLHHSPSDRILREGELVLVDAGCELNCYASDITRTYVAGDKFTPEQRALYDVVLSAQKDAILYARPGNTLAAVHAAAAWETCRGLEALGIIKDIPSNWLERDLFTPYFPHGTSHWLGLDVHDAGDYRMTPEHSPMRILEPGMVITVEPGIYIPRGMQGVDPKWHGIGIRIEDDVVITSDGNRVLTERAPKDPGAITPRPFPF